MNSVATIEHQLFDLLLSQQLSEEQQRRESLCFLYELFLVHIYNNKKLNEFVQLFLDKGVERIQKQVSENKTKQWFLDLESSKKDSTIRSIKSSFFRNLSNEMVQLYYLLRDSLTLGPEVYLQKYNYLPEFRDKAHIFQFAAGFVYKEDYLWIQCLKIAYQNGFSTKEVVDNISRIVAAHSDNSFQDFDNLISSVNASVKKGISNHNRTWFTRMLPEYFAADNPFKRSAVLLPAAKPIATQEQQNERNQQCRAAMKALLVGVGGLPQQETTVQPVTDDLPSTSRSTRLLTYRSSKPSLTHVQGDIAEGFKKHRISKSQALEFLRKKQFLQFDSMQDCICSNDGYRAYAVDEATSNEHFFLAAGVLTCTLHAFRLLLVTKTVSQDSKQNDKLQRLLNLMVNGMSSKWSVDEVLHGLGLNSFLKQPKPTFQSFVTDLVQIETQLLTQFQTTSWSTISDSGALTNVIQGLYANYSRNVRRKKDQSSVFFLPLSDKPNSDVIIPYIFLQQPDGAAKDSSTIDDSRDQSVVVLQVVGMVFEHAGNESSGERYFFQFITYSCCREDGQYQVFSVNAYGIISTSVPVPYRRDDLRKTKCTPPPPLRLKPTCRGGVLVGLILVRNDQQSSNYPDYLAPPIIRTINCPTGGDYATLTCYEISKLKTSAWLDDAIIDGAVYMMEAHLLSTHNDYKEPNQQLVRSSIFFENKIKNCNASVSFNTTFPNSSFGVFIINLGQVHWICACVSRKMQRIYIMDSYNDKNMKTCDELNAYFSKYFGWKKFKTELVICPYQEDSVSCGLFTIINAIIFLKSIITGDFKIDGPEWGWVSYHISMNDKTLMRHQLRDIFYGNANVDVLLQWIQKKG